MVASSRPTTFRFLDLPKEIRLMVYERIPGTGHYVKDHVWSLTNYHPHADEVHHAIISDVPLSMTIVYHNVSTAILLTCRGIYEEACAITMKRVRDPENVVPKIIVHAALLPGLLRFDGLLDTVIMWRDALNRDDTQTRLGYTGCDCMDAIYDIPFKDYFGRMLRANPDSAIEIALFGMDLFDGVYKPLENFVLNATGSFYNVTFKIGVAGPQYFINEEAQREYEDQLTEALESENKALAGTRAEDPLAPGRSWPEFVRAERVEDVGLDKWNADWGPGVP